MNKNVAVVLLFMCIGVFSLAQNTRINEKNSIGWYVLNTKYNVNAKLGIVGEYQWRRNNIITDWQQSLLRFGLDYKVKDNLNLRAGYAWIETYPYGENYINSFGKQFTEHRTYIAAFTNYKIGKLAVSNRYMLEQRWMGAYTDSSQTVEAKYIYINRLRYLLRLQLPLTKSEKLYAAAFNEVFIGFGKNLQENIFDQNRTSALIGYQFNKKVKIEGGSFTQIFQLGREVQGRNVIQYNTGLIFSVNVNLN